MTPGEAYCGGKLVRVIGTTHNDGGGKPFCAGILIDPATGRCCFAAPLLRWCLGQDQDKLRQSFARLGWRATVVRS